MLLCRVIFNNHCFLFSIYGCSKKSISVKEFVLLKYILFSVVVSILKWLLAMIKLVQNYFEMATLSALQARWLMKPQNFSIETMKSQY